MPKIVDHAQYRQELLRHSLALFVTHGYSGLTMRLIADTLGVTTGTLYYYFPNKEALFAELSDYIAEQDILRAFGHVQPASTLPGKIDALLRFIAMHETEFVQQLLLLVEIYQAKLGKTATVVEAMQAASEKYVRAIDTHLDLNDLALARFILIMINGLVLQRFLDNQTTSFTEQAAVLTRLLSATMEA